LRGLRRGHAWQKLTVMSRLNSIDVRRRGVAAL